MRIGAVFPQSEIGRSRHEVRRFAEGVEDLGYSHILAYEQVVGTATAERFNIHSTFHEPLVLFAYLAALTSLELVTGVIVLPQRQTVLFAKQAATLDILNDGRLRLGLAVGQKPVEYAALGEDFRSRGKRLDYQVEILRSLWTQESVSFESPREILHAGGLAPLPIQRPIPIWLGASSRPALLRAGRLGDGWIPEVQPGAAYAAALAIVTEGRDKAERPSAHYGIEGRVYWNGNLRDTLASVDLWHATGASHLSISTMNLGFQSADEHLQILGDVARSLHL